MKTNTRNRAVFFSFALLATLTRADISLPAIISAHAVLQKSPRVPIWGKAAPGEAVAVTFNGAKQETRAAADGKWRVNLDLSKEAPGPYELVVTGKNRVVVPDVLVGEVWLCSGQSNMAWQLSRTVDATNEIAHSANPFLRQFLVERNATPEPRDDCDGRWIVASPATAGNFSGVAYYFGKKLQTELQVPVGLINSSWGGMMLEALMSAESLDRDATLKSEKERAKSEFLAVPDSLRKYEDRFDRWVKLSGRGTPNPLWELDAPKFNALIISEDAWQNVTLPGKFKDVGLPDAGVIWLRKSLSLPAAMVGHDINLELGQVNEFSAVYWNGVKIGEISVPQNATPDREQKYTVPGSLAIAGPNVLTIRVYAPGAGAAVLASADQFRAGSLSLSGEWKAKVELAFPPLASSALKEYPQPPKFPTLEKLSKTADTALVPPSHKVPTYLFNAMINPLIPYAMRGVIFYHGESNAKRAFQYRTAFPLLIKDWRDRWELGDFPFYFCQIANNKVKASAPGESNLAELREAQSMTLALPATGQAILIDVGEARNIHPLDKRPPGDRLARLALARTYGRSMVDSGPTYEKVTTELNTLRISFRGSPQLKAGSLPDSYHPRSNEELILPLRRNSPKSELQGFAICGEDHAWVWADARIEGNTVVVSAPGITHPVAARYAWADNPTCNLFSVEGLPAAPFRTDDFPLQTKNSGY